MTDSRCDAHAIDGAPLLSARRAMILLRIDGRNDVELPLPQGFIGGYGDGIGQVETANSGPDRDPDSTVRVPLEQRSGQSGGLGAEDQHIPARVLHIRIQSAGGLREKPGAKIRESHRQFVPTINDFAIQMSPIIQAGASHLLLIHLESERPDKPEFRMDGDARAANIPGILRNLGLVQNDVQVRSGVHTFGISVRPRGVNRCGAVPGRPHDESENGLPRDLSTDV